MDKKLYIAYGSNLNIEQMGQRCPAAKPIGVAMLEDYELLFRGQNGNCHATVEPKENSSVPVLIWEIEEADEAALDRYEGYPIHYRKEVIEIDFNNLKVQAMIYIMNGRPIGKPSNSYLNVIKRGYIDNGLDIKFLENALK